MGVVEDEFKGVIKSIVPIAALVLALQFVFMKSSNEDIELFAICSVLVIIGFTLFLLGVKAGVIPVGNAIGAEIPRRGSIVFMIAVIFIISFLVIVAEPNVAVFTALLDNTFDGVNPTTMIYAIAVGVAVFLVLATLKTIYGLPLKLLLLVSYGIVLVIAVICAIESPEFLGIAFDSGGVITGPLTVPILLALGLGISSSMASRTEMDGFGMIGLASAGPIIAVLLMGIFAGEPTGTVAVPDADLGLFESIGTEFLGAVYSVVVALTPLVIFFVFFQKVFLKYSWLAVRRMLIGVLLAGVGIIIFLTGVYAGFMPTATALGTYLGGIDGIWVILLGLVLGFLVSVAEPAVKILGDQVEQASHGMIKGRMLIMVLGVGVAATVAIGMARVVYDIDFVYIIIPGYIIALIIMLFSDKDLVGIAFDAGGVATGPMVVTVMMAMYAGLADAMYTGQAAILNSFGIVALVALAPLIALSALGVLIKVYKRRSSEQT